jgi:hypothetical protein
MTAGAKRNLPTDPDPETPLSSPVLICGEVRRYLDERVRTKAKASFFRRGFLLQLGYSCFGMPAVAKRGAGVIEIVLHHNHDDARNSILL